MNYSVQYSKTVIKECLTPNGLLYEMNLNTLTAIFLIIGVSIGAGILGLPLAAPALGFPINAIILILCWFFMTLGAFYILEISINHTEPIDYLKLCYYGLGKVGKIFSWVFYALLLLMLISVYLQILKAWALLLITQTAMSYTPNETIVLLFMSALYGVLISQKLSRIGRFNIPFTGFLIFSLIIILIVNSFSISGANLSISNDLTILYLLERNPTLVMITAFGFAINVPGINMLLNHNTQKVRSVLMTGSAVILLLYFVWMLVSFGVIGMSGEENLLTLSDQHDEGTGVISLLAKISAIPWLSTFSKYFIISAVLSSAFGVGSAAVNFFIDAFNLNYSHKKDRYACAFLVVFGPFLLLSFSPQSLVKLLSISGSLVAISLGIIPALLVVKHRKNSTALAYKVWGGTPLVYLTILFFISTVLLPLF